MYILWLMSTDTRESLLAQIAQIQRMEPGKLCILREGPKGPYYNLQCREDGRTLSLYVPRDQDEMVASHTANYEKFQTLVGEYARQVIQQTRAERASGVKKKSQPRTSSSPKSRKSRS
jgi:hypothetical protein